ncbi:MAG: hypothetical protein JWO35_757 [Candidatus Saccharibacteria bacterium]|nr:hypothetical protein [Candidatus Saccharibacteria bacterium]
MILIYDGCMTEVITQVRAEDAIANTNAFLGAERGATLDGAFAGRQIAERVSSVQQRAEDLLVSVPHPKLDGLYVPLSKHNANRFSEAATVLLGHLVLVPSVLVEKDTSVFYPAVVSEDGLKTDVLRLHVLKQQYRQQIRYGASMILSAAGQSETKGIGEHGRKAGDGVEAEHFATLLAAGSDQNVQAAWQAGQHINHAWRNQQGNSVTSEVSKRLFGQEIPQETITITRQQIETGKAMLFWHEGMRDEQSGKPETAVRDNALVVIQGLGYEALRTSNPNGIDDVKRMIA